MNCRRSFVFGLKILGKIFLEFLWQTCTLRWFQFTKLICNNWVVIVSISKNNSDGNGDCSCDSQKYQNDEKYFGSFTKRGTKTFILIWIFLLLLVNILEASLTFIRCTLAESILNNMFLLRWIQHFIENNYNSKKGET